MLKRESDRLWGNRLRRGAVISLINILHLAHSKWPNSEIQLL